LPPPMKTNTPTDPLPRLGEGFMLRRLSIEDLTAFQVYRHDAELGRYQGWTAMSDEHAGAFLAEMHAAPFLQPGAWTQIGIAQPDSQRLIGDIGLFLDAHGLGAEIGFTLARQAQGRGVATAAVRAAIDLIFESSAAQHVVGTTDARNCASMRLLERVGMRITQTTNTLFRGEPCVEYVYAVARGEQ
jgi:[ribosomal protein S5]-alanine N-acetyltransferase